MARVKITEYKTKNLLLSDSYHGILLGTGTRVSLPKKGAWVIKVDQGVKKRFKQGLVAVNIKAAEIAKYVKAWEKKGYSQFIAEPYVEHEASEEQYFSLERVRGGLRLLHSKSGGVDIEKHPEKVSSSIVASREDCAAAASKAGIPKDFLVHVYDIFNDNFFAFLEINPLVVRAVPTGGEKVFLLDAAALVDSAAQFFVKGSWGEDDIVKSNAKHKAEMAVEALAATTPAALSLKVLNKDGAIFFLLSGGGGSIVIADEAAMLGAGNLLGNYGEYSGGPTREETYLYAQEVLSLMLASKSKKKALVIAGGVANFTDIKVTFAGIIDALADEASRLRKAGVKVFVRRGGPNEVAGLAMMRDFLVKEQLLGSVYGSDTIVTQAIEDAVTFVQKK